MNASLKRSAQDSKPRFVAVCADDFGLSTAVNDAVLELIEAGVLQATSVLVGAKAWQAGVKDLLAVASGRADIGLHLDFTEHPLVHERLSLGRLILRAYTRTLDAARVRHEIDAQLDAFEAVAGRSPDYIDGHQHVHQLPVIREQLVASLAARRPSIRPWVRATSSRAVPSASLGLAFKQRVIEGLGNQALGRLCIAHQLKRNRRLLGIYDFAGDQAHYARLLESWLACAAEGDLLMCHPAVRADPGDPIGAARAREYAVLKKLDVRAHRFQAMSATLAAR
jgi:chitin disaccharide deacetylase